MVSRNYHFTQVLLGYHAILHHLFIFVLLFPLYRTLAPDRTVHAFFWVCKEREQRVNEVQVFHWFYLGLYTSCKDTPCPFRNMDTWLPNGRVPPGDNGLHKINLHGQRWLDRSPYHRSILLPSWWSVDEIVWLWLAHKTSPWEIQSWNQSEPVWKPGFRTKTGVNHRPRKLYPLHRKKLFGWPVKII